MGHFDKRPTPKFHSFGPVIPIMIFLPPRVKALPFLAGCGRGGIRTPDTVVHSHIQSSSFQNLYHWQPLFASSPCKYTNFAWEFQTPNVLPQISIWITSWALFLSIKILQIKRNMICTLHCEDARIVSNSDPFVFRFYMTQRYTLNSCNIHWKKVMV